MWVKNLSGGSRRALRAGRRTGSRKVSRGRVLSSKTFWGKLIPSLQSFFLGEEDIPSPLLMSCASAMHIPLKTAASPGERNPCGCPARSSSSHTSPSQTESSFRKEVWGKRGSNKTCSVWLWMCVGVHTPFCDVANLQFSGFC